MKGRWGPPGWIDDFRGPVTADSRYHAKLAEIRNQLVSRFASRGEAIGVDFDEADEAARLGKSPSHATKYMKFIALHVNLEHKRPDIPTFQHHVNWTCHKIDLFEYFLTAAFKQPLWIAEWNHRG